MTRGMKYGDVALGVEAALPAAIRPRNRAHRLINWLIAVLRRRA